MLFQRMGVFAVGLLLLGTIAQGAVGAAPQRPLGAVPVALADDMTQAAQCVTWVDTPAHQRPCPAGAVIVVRRTTLAAVARRSPHDYVRLTGHAQHDARAMQQLADRMHARLAPPPLVPRATCTAVASKTIGGSYLSNPSNTSSPRISYEVNYRVSTSCSVSNVQDRSRISTGKATWVLSCTLNGQNCTIHDLVFDTIWTSWRPEIGSLIGGQYAHESYVGAFSARPYGYTYFVN